MVSFIFRYPLDQMVQEYFGGVEEMSNDEMTLWKRNGLELPLRTDPIRFAVKRRSGLASNSWGVRVERKGDAYIYCRDAMRDQKVSLHASGKQHISFNENAPSMRSYTGGRFMNQWREPQHSQKAVSTFRLLFPFWGLSLNAEQRGRVHAIWDKNDVLIPGHDKMVYRGVVRHSRRWHAPPEGEGVAAERALRRSQAATREVLVCDRKL